MLDLFVADVSGLVPSSAQNSVPWPIPSQ